MREPASAPCVHVLDSPLQFFLGWFLRSRWSGSNPIEQAHGLMSLWDSNKTS